VAASTNEATAMLAMATDSRAAFQWLLKKNVSIISAF
jgi:hypothetical protein